MNKHYDDDGRPVLLSGSWIHQLMWNLLWGIGLELAGVVSPEMFVVR